MNSSLILDEEDGHVVVKDVLIGVDLEGIKILFHLF